MSATSSISAASPKRGVSSFTLKVVAIVGMTFNHACYIFYPYLPAEALLLLFGFGGLTFPIMAFLLVEGYHHTSNIKRYAGRLLAFALVSQVPYALCDWGIIGPLMILMMRAIPDRRQGIVVPLLVPILGNGLPALSDYMAAFDPALLPFALYPLLGCTATIPLLLAYNGSRGRPMKWLFYAYYPAHILVLGLAKGLLLGDWTLGL